MSEKIRIDVNEIKRIEERRREINSIPLENIEWVDGDMPVNIPAKHVEDWKFIGLSNCCFAETEFYLTGLVEQL